MTGKELIIYILENNLLDEKVIKDGVPIFLLDLNDAAVKFDVGPAMVKAWAEIGMIESEHLKDGLYIYATEERE